MSPRKQIMSEPELPIPHACQDVYQSASRSPITSHAMEAPCQGSLLHNSHGEKLELTEDMMTAYNIMRGPQPVSRKDPLLEQMQANNFLFNGSDISSNSGSTAASSLGLSKLKHSQCSQYHSTIITPPDDADDWYSDVSDRTITCNIRRSPEKRAILHQPLVVANDREMRAEVVGDPWKCGPIDVSKYRLPPATGESESKYGNGSKPDLSLPMISPATFRSWSEGAQLWDTDILHRESRSKEILEPTRMRPTTPLQPRKGPCCIDTPKPRSFPVYEEQYDQEDGERMSPHYKVPLHPSILWEPRPITPDMMYRCFPHGEFDRMNPVAAQACRDASLGPIPSFGATDISPVDGETFSEDEIDEVLNTHRGPIFDDITSVKYKEAISTIEEEIIFLDLEESQQEQQNESQRQLLRSLELHLASLLSESASVEDGSGSPSVSKTKICYSTALVHRRARILQHMASRLRENLWQHNCRREAIAAACRESDLVHLQIQHLQGHIEAASARKAALCGDVNKWRASAPDLRGSQWQ